MSPLSPSAAAMAAASSFSGGPHRTSAGVPRRSASTRPAPAKPSTDHRFDSQDPPGSSAPQERPGQGLRVDPAVLEEAGVLGGQHRPPHVLRQLVEGDFQPPRPIAGERLRQQLRFQPGFGLLTFGRKYAGDLAALSQLEAEELGRVVLATEAVGPAVDPEHLVAPEIRSRRLGPLAQPLVAEALQPLLERNLVR